MAELNTIIVLRNGSKEAWEAEGSYTLRVGEVGVGYMDVYNEDGTAVVKTMPIFKIGDGVHSWKELPQAEGVLEKDVTLTSTFGRFTPSAAGFVKVPGSKGMTTTEFLMHALSQVKEPTITAPSYSLSANSLGTKEIGSTINAISYNGTFNAGSYEFGSKKGTTPYTKAQGPNQTATYVMSCTPASGSGIEVGTVEQKLDGTVSFTKGYVVKGTSSGTIATVYGTCSWTASDRTPLNNVGEPTEGILGAGNSGEKSATFSVAGYREGFYFGTTTTAITDPSKLTSADIRQLSKTGKAYAAGTKTVNVPVGAASIILACPKANTGVKDILNTTVNAGMNDAFGLTTPTVISVGGADANASSIGNFAADYNVWVYTPAEKYGNTASLTVTLG